MAPAQSVVGILDAGNSGISSASGIGSSSAGQGQGFIGSSSSGNINGGGIISTGSSGGSSSSSLGGGHSVAQSATYLPPSH